MATPATDVQAQLLLRRDRLESVMRRGGDRRCSSKGCCATWTARSERAVERHLRHLRDVRRPDRSRPAGGRPARPLLPRPPDGHRSARARAGPRPRRPRAADAAAAVADWWTLGWEIAYHYQPLGAVSGDYCDVVRPAGLDDGLLSCSATSRARASPRRC